MQLQYLFDFRFTKTNIDSHLGEWMRATKTDYFYNGQSMYADIYGCGDYYLITTKHITGNVHEVYADTDKVMHNSGLKRIFPMIAKAVSVQAPFRKVKVLFSDGEKITTEIRSCSEDAAKFYLGSQFAGNVHAEKIEFLA